MNMKTLDEVIEELQYWDTCNEYPECFYDDEVTRDALNYLKEFKRISAKIEKIALGDVMETLEKLDNPALTWEELKQMEGKPVWIEFLNDEGEWNGEWCLVESSNNILCEILRCKMSWFGLRKITLGKTWQAYRKERNEDVAY